MNKETEHVKIFFPIKDEQLPVESESMWAKVIDADNMIFELDNSPFWLYGISYRDQIKAEITDENIFSFVEIYKKGGHSTLRVILKEGTLKSLEKLTQLGATYEGMSKSYFSVDIAPNIDMEPIESILNEGTEQGLWEYEKADLNHV